MLDLNNTTVGCYGHMFIRAQDLWRNYESEESEQVLQVILSPIITHRMKSDCYLSVLEPLQCWGRKGLSCTLEGQRAVDLDLDLFGCHSLPWNIILIDLRRNWGQETCLEYIDIVYMIMFHPSPRMYSFNT